MNMAWYYTDHDNDVVYWCYSNEMSTTQFASCVSSQSDERITASDTSAAHNTKDLEKRLDNVSYNIHIT